ncbi:hypothetical protein BJX76DRAFT_319093 [Aspergillus varians]
MHFSLSQVFLAGLSCSVALAAPAPAPAKSMMVADSVWTIEDVQRICNSDDTECTWTFGIQAGSSSTPCTYVVNGSKADGGPTQCGAYSITSSWNDDFGADNGFTTLAFINQETREIAWPSYNDKQLADGNVVKPDQSYTASALS